MIQCSCGFLRILCPLILLLVRSHLAEIIIVKRLIQGLNNVTRVQVEPRSFDQGRCKNDAFTHSATLPTVSSIGSLEAPMRVRIPRSTNSSKR